MSGEAKQCCDFVSLVFFSFVLLRHFRSSQRRQKVMEQDVKQAQEVQRVPIPEELPCLRNSYGSF